MRIIFAALCFVFSTQAFALTPDEVLKDINLEARARIISKELRCMVCQNQSIDDSDAQLAKDLRVIVRERLVAGDSDAQIFEFVEARYGEFVLLKPRVNAHTIALWLSPVLIVLAGLGLVWRRKTMAIQTAALTEDEQKRIEALLKEY